MTFKMIMFRGFVGNCGEFGQYQMKTIILEGQRRVWRVQMTVFLTELFMPWLGADSNLTVDIDSEFRIGVIRPTQKFPRVMIVKFLQWPIKARVIDCFREQPEVKIVESEIAIYSNLSAVMLKKPRNLRFLTLDLQKKKIPYR